IASLIFLRRLELLLAERERAGKHVGACSAQTRNVQNPENLLSRIDFEYPCGWHVVEEALVRKASRRGIVSDIVYVNPDPISFAPRDVEPSRIIIGIDEQDPSRRYPRLKTRAQYVDETSRQYTSVTITELAANAGGIIFTKIEGEQMMFEQKVPVVNYIAELFDKNQPERRRILQIWSGNPAWEDGSVERALTLLIQTLKQI
ncbi:hypothetical protein HY629_00045, partial [Candidatus Uhrbacteria bacterium]|nr:hypothetical protein [Candidatus Uhrbacteria bacterium]